MKKFANFLGKFPFAGKIEIRLLFSKLYGSATQLERRKAFLNAAAFMLYSVFAHGLQAKLGIIALNFNAPVSIKIIYFIYAITNISVCIVHSYISYRICKFYLSRPFPNKHRDLDGYSADEESTMVKVTFTGQIAFGITFFAYLLK